jgi:hypothetical protein
MSFKVKNSQLSNEALKSINDLIDKDINSKAAFKLSRILKHLSSIVEDKLVYEKKIFDKWVQKDDNGTPQLAKDDNGQVIPDAFLIKDVNEFTKEMSELMNIESEIPFEKIDFDELGLATIKVKDLIKIEFLFCEFKD